MRQRFDRGQFQFKQRRLMRIDIDAIDLRRPFQQVVESVATCTGDHDDPIRIADAERGVIDSRILPALVIQEGPFVKSIEEPSSHGVSIGKGRCNIVNAA
jgi:hypothetical protein